MKKFVALAICCILISFIVYQMMKEKDYIIEETPIIYAQKEQQMVQVELQHPHALEQIIVLKLYMKDTPSIKITVPISFQVEFIEQLRTMQPSTINLDELQPSVQLEIHYKNGDYKAYDVWSIQPTLDTVFIREQNTEKTFALAPHINIHFLNEIETLEQMKKMHEQQ